MSVSVITSTEPKNANIFAVSAAGGAAGLAVRQFLPVQKPEIDAVLFSEAGKIRRNNIRQARKNAVSDIVKMFNKDKNNEALKLFLERTRASVKYENACEAENMQAKREAVKLAKAAKEKIKAAPENIRQQITKLTETVVNKVRAARYLTEDTIKNSVRMRRPFAAFILPGVALGAMAAFVYNVIGTINRD